MDDKQAAVAAMAIKAMLRMKSLKDVHRIQNATGVWDQGQYSLGLANGLELALSIMEDREPVLKVLKGLRPPGMHRGANVNMLTGIDGVTQHDAACTQFHDPRQTPCSMWRK